MDNGASTSKSTKAFQGFVKNITGIEVWSDKDVGLTTDSRSREFFVTNFGIDGSIKLHFSVDNIIRMVFADFVYDEMNFFEIGIFAAGTIGGVGKHGYFGLKSGVVFESFGSVFDDGIEFFGIGLFVDAAISDSNDLIAFSADETARKEIRFKREMIFVSKKDIT